MISKIAFFFFLFVSTKFSNAQNLLSGIVNSQSGEPIPFVNVICKDSLTNKTLSYTQTDSKGFFSIKNIRCDSVHKYRFEFRCLGYTKYAEAFTSCKELKSIRLMPSQTELKEIIVKSPTVRRTNDTLVYDVNKLKDSTDFVLRDILAKIPGINVSKNGTISYNNEPIVDFQIMGSNLMGGRYTVLNDLLQVKNLQSIEVMENHNRIKSSMKDLNNPKTGINIILKKDKLVDGNMTAGLGLTKAYLAEIKPLIITPKYQALVTLGIDNIGRNSTQSLIDHFESKPFNDGRILDVRRIENMNQNDARFFTNNSANGSINYLKKLKNEFEFKFNLISSIDKNKESGINFLRYQKAITNLPLETSEQLNNIKDQFNNNARFSLEKNSNKHFFNYTLNYDFDQQIITGDAKLSTTGLFIQEAKFKRNQLSNAFQWNKQKGNKTFALKGNQGFQVSPQSLGLDRIVFQNNIEHKNVFQDLNLKNSRGSLVYDISVMKNKYQTFSSFGIQGNLQDLVTHLQFSENLISNKIRFRSSKVFFNQNYNIKLFAYSFLNSGFNVVLNPTQTSQPNLGNSTNQSKTFGYIEPKVGLNFRSNQGNTLNFRYFMNNTFGDIMQMHSNLILYDYRTFTSRNVVLSRKISNNFIGNFRYNNIFKNINFGLGLAYISSSNNQFSNLNISKQGNETMSFLNSKFRSQSYSFTGDFMTFNFSKKSRFTITSLLFYSTLPISRNEQVFKSKSVFSETKIASVLFIKKRVKLNSSLNVIHNNTINQNLKIGLTNFSLMEGLSLYFPSKSFIEIDYLLDYNSYSKQFNNFINVKTEKRVKALVFALEGRNILNSKFYYLAKVNEYFESSTTINQRPIQVVLSITKTF